MGGRFLYGLEKMFFILNLQIMVKIDKKIKY